MRTTQTNYDMKVRLFKCEYPTPNYREQTKLDEMEYNLPKFTKKEKYFKDYFERVRHLITEEIKVVNWVKGSTWHDDMLLIGIGHESDYYKISHFS